MSKIYCVVTVARQMEGEMISVRFEKAWHDLAKAQGYASTLAKTFNETIMVPNVGQVDFVCERGIHELELQD